MYKINCLHYNYITNLKEVKKQNKCNTNIFFTFQTARAAGLYFGCPQCRLAHALTAHVSNETMGLYLWHQF